MERLYVVLRIGGQRVAIPASQVESVVEIGAITPIPRAPVHVVGLAALRSRVVTVIDALAPSRRESSSGGPLHGLVATVDGHTYALLVDGVDDVVEADGEVLPVEGRLAPEWHRLACGMIEAEGDLLLLLDVSAMVAGPSGAGP